MEWRMARPNLSAEKRKQLLPEIARAFSEFGYRRTTTAELARRAKVQENILYRLWPSKKSMFIAAIDCVLGLTVEMWNNSPNCGALEGIAAEQPPNLKPEHHIEFGFYRIVFAGLSESDDPEIRAALRSAYTRFHQLIYKQIRMHRIRQRKEAIPHADLAAWAFLGVASMAHLCGEFGLLAPNHRLRLLGKMGEILLGGCIP
jgi:AcrR family transcriptional regulator